MGYEYKFGVRLLVNKGSLQGLKMDAVRALVDRYRVCKVEQLR